MPNCYEKKKERETKRSVQRKGERAVLQGQCCRDRSKRENKIDRGKVRASQRVRRRQKIRTDCES